MRLADSFRRALKDGLLAGINDRLPQAPRYSQPPVRTSVAVAKVRHKKAKVSNLISKPRVDEFSFRPIVEAKKLKAGLLHRRSKMVLDDTIERSVANSLNRYCARNANFVRVWDGLLRL